MFQLRIYTLRTADALERYSTVHCPSPMAPTQQRSPTEYMASPEFVADMEGFDVQDVLAVDTMLLDATRSSPTR
jgi:hypothetical protein